MDSYNIFGDDGSGMLEGLTDLGGSDSFSGNSSSGVAGDNKDAADNSYRQPYNPGNAQEGSHQKLPPFGATSGGGITSSAPGPAPGGPPAPEYHEYGAYPPRPRMPQPPHGPSHAPHHPPHHVHPSHAYPGYHPGPDPMYGMPEQPGLSDMGGWPGAPGSNRYSPITPGYRHSYEHQQKIHQYPPQQGPGIGGLQAQNGGYLPRQPHFSQPTSQQLYGQQQSYPNYTQMHPPSASRISQHPTYHQQMDVNPHQYGLSHGQQSHGAIPQHQPHQSMGGHGGGLGSAIQGHPGAHLHHAGAPPIHHLPRQPPGPPSTAAPSHPVPSQMSYAAPHHAVSMNYQSHQVQHPLDVNVSNQYGAVKPSGLETGSPQYRPPFPQLSPQMSPRAQMSPRQQPQPQLSPRPVMSPVKGPSASPHSARNLVPSPVSSGPPPSSNSYSSQNTLQALEQMVLPAGGDYSYQRNPASPAVGHMVPSPSHWSQSKMQIPVSNVTSMESSDQNLKPHESLTPMTPMKPDLAVNLPMPSAPLSSTDMKIADKNQTDTDKTNDSVSTPHTFTVPMNVSKDVKAVSPSNAAPRQLIHPTSEPLESKDKTKQENKNNENNLPVTKDDDAVGNEMKKPAINNQKMDSEQLQENSTKKTLPPAASSASDKPQQMHNMSHQSPINTIGNSNQFENLQAMKSYQSLSLPSNVTTAMPNIMHQMPPTSLPPTSLPPSSLPQTNLPPSSLPPQSLSSSSLPPPSHVSPSMAPSNIPPPTLPPSNIPNVQPNLQSTTTHGAPPTFQSAPTSGAPPPGNMQSNHSMPHPTIANSISSGMPPGHSMPPAIGSLQNNMQQPHPQPPHSQPPHSQPPHPQPPHPNVPSNLPVQGNTNNMPPVGVPMVPPVHQGMGPNQPNMMPNIPHNIMMMGPNAMPPHPNLPNIYPPSHHQERMSLNQQIQEIYCLPPCNENQEKVRCLQERLSLLQQHETADKCNGGPNCMLQNPLYGSKMVESPQVTSTTGRGRGKGPPKPRKPRAKKEKQIPAVQPLDQLPVSEDCVTAGTGLLNNSEMDLETGEDITNLDSSAILMNEIGEKVKKPRAPRKERKPRTPKEPKIGKDGVAKPVKERKKREPKDPNAPKRKRNSKKEATEVLADTTSCYDFTDKEDSKSQDQISLNKSIASTDSARNTSDVPVLDDSTVTDFDDIPVSKIAIKDLLEEAEAKRELDDDDTDSQTQKRRSKKRSAGRKSSIKKTPSSSKKKKRGGIVPDSDGEPDDMMSTPPPSPPVEDDSLKRRSARNTQRKKYTDDVMLRLSDEEFPGAPKREKEVNMDDIIGIDIKDVPRPDGLPKPNYIYVNTTEEDAMIVQHVLACRMGKRELKPEPAPIPESLPKTEETIAVENKENGEETKPTGDDDKSDIKETPVEPEGNVPENKSDKDTKENIKENSENEPENVVKPETAETKLESAPVEKKDQDTVTEDGKKELVLVDVEEYYVKYRNFSYLHCEWKTEEELYKGDKRIFSKIKRFKQKQAQQMNIFELLDDEPFNPDYIEVERILDMSENQDPANDTVVKHYLVKWKSLQYEDSTWELEEDIDVDKIKQYKIFSETPPKEKWKYKKRPSADHWVQLKESPLYKGGNTLRPYQLEGLNWLLFSWHNNRNCILADEMGLGKTIQSLTFVNSVWEYGIRGPFLIIAPLSTIPNWQREFEGWTDMNVIVYHGSQQSKSMIQEYEFYYKNEKGEPIKDITKFNVLITTFEIIVTDFQELKSFNWRICVIDEAHRLKNRNCKLLEGLRQLHLEHRVLLSGTPLQNNVNELFSLLNFLEPAQFASSEAFLNEFGDLKTESEVVKLQALLKPMMLRRLKEDVEKTLAPKEETIIEVELTNIQKKYYRAILERNFSFLVKGTASANIPNLMNTMMELRKCCIHPYLLNGAEDQIQFDYKQAHGEDKEAYYKALIQSSGKMVLVDKLLPKLKAGGHRVLIFSQMVRCLDILEDYLVFRKYPFERIDGRIRGNLRQEAIDRFSKPDSDRFVFLLCTKAGGLGINLTAADTVIIYDSDWNPQNDLQAQARCHRIGQQKMVKIYRLLCRNTYEREMFDKASMKLGLDKAILQSMNTGQGKEAGLKQLSKKEIEDLLKKGAYGAVMDEDNAGDKFCEEDIEMILARRTQVIQMESEKGSTFSKASFSAANQRSDIDIRDPDFWNKWAKKAEIDTTEKKEDEDLIVTEPRKRTVIKRYGHDDGPMEMSDMEATPDSEEDEDGIGLRSKKKKDKHGRKGRRYASDDYIPRHEGVPMDEEVVYGSWTRSECFKIERGLLTFGWARWDEVVDKNQLRKGWTQPVIEDCARIIVLYCLRHYKGDEKIRNFIWDLIEPCENGEVTISRNHSGLHNPVPRGRNAKKKNRPKDVPKPQDTPRWEDPNHWSSNEKYDCEMYLESSYKKHLFRHANKVLLRVRMMYYIKHEVIGDYATPIENGTHASALNMRVPRGVDSAPPRLWWDTECDVSLLVGTYIHGYENYLAMRSDPQLCFVDKLGPPDDAECTDIKSEERKVRGSGVGDEDCTDDVSSGAGATSPAASPRPDDDGNQDGGGGLWPSMQDLNTRLRRLITAYQRNYKREELKLQQRAKMERRERMEQLARDEVSQWRWTRADEEAFRRTVASYGVEFDPATKSLRWSRFRSLARLDSKSDDALTDYLKAFMAMCKRQCGLSVGEAELPTRADLKAEPIGEERAIATLERIDLLRVLREEVAPHPALDARLALCERSPDAPAWWQPQRHDKLLVQGVCKHGLGDTYNKLFCDPKLPFADCARKWYATHKSSSSTPAKTTTAESQKASSDEEDRSIHETRMSLRRSKRTNPERDDDDTDALSELETLAKLGRVEEPLSPEHWFSERALETRLHHIAHAVQTSEWPAAGAVAKDGARAAHADAHDAKHTQKRHIAIDVETERAKLHALLSSPAAAHAQPASASRDDASSDSGSRRSTPAPPPAHQRVAPSPASQAPVDLSAPAALDLSEVQDFSMGRRTPMAADAPASTASATPPRSRLDDTLSRLMKRKNVPAPEQIVGKEKKRKKLDEIVLGLSAAKTSSPGPSASEPPSRGRERAAILPDVTVTPAAPSTSSHAPPAQKPFSVTLTNVPSPQTSKESFLQQSLEQSIKIQKTPPVSSVPGKSYSHEAKVNKWLAEQASVDARRRGAAPVLAPDERVPVVHRVTGKRIVGHKAPQLKHLAQWIAENPMYDIDSKWTEGIKEHVKLPQDVRSHRHSPMQSTSSMGERKKGRPPTLDAASANVLSSSSHLNQNLASLNPALLASLSSLSAFDPKTLAATLSNLTGFDQKLLNTFDPKLLSSLGSFDPKNNPLLSSFGSMPNLLGNMAGGNIFANLAGLGLPGFSGLDMNALSGAGTSGDSKSKSRKSTDPGTSASSKASSNSQFPFVFPNPNMLYPQLGLGGLNPFGMHTAAGMSSAYDALGLLSNNLAASSASSLHSSGHSTSRTSTKTTTPRSSTVVTNSSTSRQQKVSDRQQSSQLPQILLPPDPYLLESLSKQSLSYDALFRADKKGRESESHETSATDLSKVDKKKAYDAPRAHVPPEFAAVQEKLLKGDKKDIDISKMLLEQMASGALSASLVSSAEAKRAKDIDKDSFEKLNKPSSEYVSRTLTSDDGAVAIPLTHKRSHEEMASEPENLALQQSTDLNPSKKIKENPLPEGLNLEKRSDPSSHTGEMDLEDLIAPSTVIKTGMKSSDFENVSKLASNEGTSPSFGNSERDDKAQSPFDDPSNLSNVIDNGQSTDNTCKSEIDNSATGALNEDGPSNDPGRRGNRKKGRKPSDESIPTGPRRELRSSSGRQSTETNPMNH